MTAAYITEDSARVCIIVLLSFTSIVGIARLGLATWSNHTFRAEDYWFLGAFACYVGMCGIYIVINHLAFKIDGLKAGTVPIWPTVLQDVQFMLKRLFACTTLFVLLLYFVKFSILSFYRQLLSRVRGYVWAWWAVLVFCILSMIVSLLTQFFSCGSDITKEWNAAKCVGPANVLRSFTSLWTNYALDVATDLAIMALPLDMIYKTQMPLRQKLSVGGMFSLGFVCIIFATIRAKEVGSTASPTHLASITWLEVWAVVETSVAVWVGAAAGIYRATKNIGRNRTAASYGYGGSGGYGTASKRSRHLQDSGIQLQSGRGYANRATVLAQHGRPTEIDDASSSQEELAKSAAYANNGIAVTQETRIASDDQKSDYGYGWRELRGDRV